ncbi:hypothetical protein CKY20_11230 [Capnocytophaga canis]|uniref:Uncharacterized protein n=1 Tax=Capnocytophaga canis TaxID=1848903 RepID=A0A3A1YDA3_9FLAO|nr:hypothetical protein [Capnocytophaga canis]RIY35150.1 hypothetical protein CKY20_11230 [Capnocytophaga canis]
MKQATKYILKAIHIEIILTLITFFIVNILMGGGVGNIPTILIIYVISVMPCIGLAYLVGQKINYSKIEEGVRFFFGIILIFVLLTISFSLGGLISYLIYEFKLLSYSEWLNIAVTFYLFGGLQTLCVGMWLGYKLSGLKS